MTRELFIDNQRVDLPDDVRFQLTFEIASFGELKPRGSGSNTIRLPKTPRNTAIFDNCNFVQVASDYPYVLHSAYYYEDGWLVFNDATVYMLAITQTDFEIQCVWGNATEIRRLKGLDMGDVTGLGNVNYDADAYAAVETGIHEYQGALRRFALSVRGSNVYSPYTRGVLSLRKALSAIQFDEDGMSDAVKGYIENLYVFPAVKSAKIPYRNVTFAYPKRTTPLESDESSIYRGNIKGLLSLWSQETAYGNNRKFSFVFDPSPNDYTSRIDTSRTGITPQMPAGKWYDVQLTVTIHSVALGIADRKSAEIIDRSKFRIGVVLGQIMGQFTNRYWDFDSGNAVLPSGNDSTLVVSGNLPAETYPQPVTLTASKRLYVNNDEVQLSPNPDDKGVPPVYLAIYPYTTNPIWRPKPAYAQVTAEATLKVSAVAGEIDEDIHMPEETDDYRNHMTVKFADVLRGTTAYDFVTQAILNAGAIFDSKDGRTRVYTYEDIANNGDMPDWSDKLVYIKEESTFNQSGGSRNEVNYRQTEYYNGYGDGSFADPLAQQLQKENKTVVENNLFGFVNDNGVAAMPTTNAAFLPFILQKTNSDGTKENEYKESGMHLVRLVPRGGTGKDFGGYLVNRAGQRVYGVSEKTMASAVTQPTFDNIEATNWAAYTAIQTNYRKAKALFMLTGQDVAELDFKKPIYLRQYAQSYIVTKVNYQPQASTVEMLLIR